MSHRDALSTGFLRNGEEGSSSDVLSLACRHFPLPAGNSSVLPVQLHNKNSWSPEWEELAGRGNRGSAAA